MAPLANHASNPSPLPSPRSTAQRQRGYVPLWMALLMAALIVVALVIWTIQSMSSAAPDGRQTIVFWGARELGEDIYQVVNQFEHLPENLDASGKPKYKIILGTA